MRGRRNEADLDGAIVEVRFKESCLPLLQEFCSGVDLCKWLHCHYRLPEEVADMTPCVALPQ